MRTLWRCLRHPRAQLYAFDMRKGHRRDIQCAAWGWLVLIAVSGNAAFASCVPRGFWSVAPSVLALPSPSLSWFVLVPALSVLTRRRPSTCVHACFVTIAYGVAALAAGGAINVLLRPGPAFCGLWFALSNVVMAAALARQFSALGVSARRTVAAWVIFLDGSAAAIAFGGLR